MRWFVTLLNEGGGEAVGSFANVTVDGRFNLDNVENEAHELLNRERRTGRNYVGFVISRGDGWLRLREVKRWTMHPDSIKALKEMKS